MRRLVEEQQEVLAAFMAVGASINFNLIAENPNLILGLTLGIVALKSQTDRFSRPERAYRVFVPSSGS